MTALSCDLIAVLCVYNEEALLPACLASLHGKVDRIVVADGRYKAFPGEGGASTDRTLDIAREHGCDIIEAPDDGWNTEHEKRTALVRTGGLGDTYLVIDADERLVGGADLKFIYGDYQLDVIGVEKTPGRQQAVRLFAHRDGLEYRWHFGLFTPSGHAVLLGHDRILPNVAHLEHHHHLRTPERVSADKEYEAHLVDFERSLGAYGPVEQREAQTA